MSYSKSKGISNPFNIGSCARGEGFFNRKEILQDIRIFLDTETEHHFLIHGQRRIGKTSLLRYIQDTTPSLIHPVFYDLQDNAMTPLKELLKRIAVQAILDTGHDLSINTKKIEVSEFSSIIKKLCVGFKKGEMILLLFDEFDVLGNFECTRANPLSNSFSSNSFIPFITHWIEEIATDHLPVKFIFAAGRNYRDLEDAQYGQLLKFGRQKELEYFEKNDVEDLIQTLSDSIVTFTREAMEAIYSITAGHPYFTQALAGESIKEAQVRKQKKTTKENVYAAFEPAIKAVAGGVEWFWGQFSPRQKILLYIISHLVEENTCINQDTIQSKAVDEQLLPGLENFEETIPHLIRSKILTTSRNNLCSGLMVPFFRKWIVHEVKKQELMPSLLEIADEELNLNLVMANFYYHKKPDMQKALEYFDLILEKNPYHFESNFSAGKILYKLYEQSKENSLFLRAMERVEFCYLNEPLKARQEWERIILDLIRDQEAFSFDEQILAAKISKLKQPSQSLQDELYLIIRPKKTLLIPFLNTLEIPDILRLFSQEVDIPEKIHLSDKNAIIRYFTVTDQEVIKEIEEILHIKKLKQLDEFTTDNFGYTANQAGQILDLGLFGCKIQNLDIISNNLIKFKTLTKLDLGDNQLTTLPAEIGQLQGLQTLDLRYNQLTTLPAEIAQLQSLQELYLQSNQLTTLPAEIAQLQSLQTLDLDNNQLTTLPVEITQLKNLQKLGLSDNQLTTIPAEISQLQNLQELVLGGNMLSTLPAEIGQLKSLQELYLQVNQLTTIPAEIAQLQRLHRLYLNGNPLKRPPLNIAKQGIKAIRNYFQSLKEQGEEFVD